MIASTQTITAPATPPGQGGVAIIRVSGPLTAEIAQHVIGRLPAPRFATYATFLDHDGSALDQGIALYFPKPNSFTGEDVLELHGHGGLAVVDRILRRMLSLGARLARPGEFSERAFLNNKMDLVQAEAIADLIAASSEQAARAAMRSLQGEFSKKVNALVQAVVDLRVYVEASIDFVEEEINFLTTPELQKQLADIFQQLHTTDQAAKQGSLLRDGITIVLAGEPNVGKSSLLNCLTGKDCAIVTSIAGTTRDVLRETLSLDGIPIHIMDTAGLRDSRDEVEQEGIRRAHSQISQADIVLWVTDAKSEIKDPSFSKHTLVIRNKIDLLAEAPTKIEKNGLPVISLSAKTGAGIELLKHHIKAYLGFEETHEGAFSARRRHQDALKRAKQFLQNAREVMLQNAGELLAEELRQAQLALNEITGKFTTDDLLGRIFSSFCVGK